MCGGYQLLGHSYALGGESIAGVGLLDVRTVRGDGPRLIGNIAIEFELDSGGARAFWPALRTTVAVPSWARISSRSAGSCAVTATTGTAALRVPAVGT